ncbi:zinc finger protein 546-like [Elysia marginata]|uniref:Zinc finger protein 546-like n=1 Tax=Elysia marginata TaxID=1093978 RepID=A0AAV4EY88_9GAST|nr:zinc finger protein 546-like [Elysia marginata]
MRHQREKHGAEAPHRYLCDDCGASYFRFRQHIREKHVDTTPEFLCEKCGLGFSRITYLQRHRCDEVSVRKNKRKRKGDRKGEEGVKRKRGDKALLEPYRPDIMEDDLEGEGVDNIISLIEGDGVREIYRNHWTSLRTHYREGPNHSHYTFRWESQTEPSWKQWLRSVFSRQEKRFKLNLSHSFVLFNREADEFRFFHASKNNARVWDKPKTICRFRDISSIVDDLKAVDTLEYVRQQRPNTKWTVHGVASTTFYVDKLPDFPIERKQLGRHEKRCAGDDINHNYPGGVYHPNPTPLEVLADDGVPVETDFVSPFRATYDFECYFTKNDIPTTSTSKTSYTVRHVPLSVSVCSNVPGFENPMCLISDGDPQNLVDRMGDHLEEISTSAFQILSDTCFKEAFEYLETLREDDVKDRPKLKGTLFKYLSQLPVVGFNSGKYDLNVIKPYLAQRFLILKDDDYDSEAEDGSGFGQTRKRFVIKKKEQ